MQIPFTKMQGCGNDYIYIDCRGNGGLEAYAADAERVRRLTDRHLGIGGDGVILVCDSENADCRMRIFNADGGEAEMCGNGIRCVAAFVGGAEVRVETRAGVKTVTKRGELYSVDMGAAEISGDRVNMGNPHRVFFVEDVDSIDIDDLSQGMDDYNVEFAEVTGGSQINMRVRERGSGETLACGTGACAVAAAAAARGLTDGGQPITVKMRGGELICSLQECGRPQTYNVTLTGGAEAVFTGVVNA